MPEERVPDAKKIWLFREQLAKTSTLKELFYDFDVQLQQRGLVARKGQIVDASFVEAPKQSNRREDNEKIEKGETPGSFKVNLNKLRQKDMDALLTKKNDEKHYGYKNHIAVDNAKLHL